jgi:hypothetical protein
MKNKRTVLGRHAHRPNKYANLKPSDQKNTSGQRRERRIAARKLAA